METGLDEQKIKVCKKGKRTHPEGVDARIELGSCAHRAARLPSGPSGMTVPAPDIPWEILQGYVPLLEEPAESACGLSLLAGAPLHSLHHIRGRESAVCCSPRSVWALCLREVRSSPSCAGKPREAGSSSCGCPRRQAPHQGKIVEGCSSLLLPLHRSVRRLLQSSVAAPACHSRRSGGLAYTSLSCHCCCSQLGSVQGGAHSMS